MAWYDDYQGRYYHRRDRLHTPTVNVFSGCPACAGFGGKTHGSFTPALPYDIDEPDPALGAFVLGRQRRLLAGWANFGGYYGGFGQEAAVALPTAAEVRSMVRQQIEQASCGHIDNSILKDACLAALGEVIHYGLPKLTDALISEGVGYALEGRDAFKNWFNDKVKPIIRDAVGGEDSMNKLFPAGLDAIAFAVWDRINAYLHPAAPVPTVPGGYTAGGTIHPSVQYGPPAPAVSAPIPAYLQAGLQYAVSQMPPTIAPLQFTALTPGAPAPSAGGGAAKVLVPIAVAAALFLLLR